MEITPLKNKISPGLSLIDEAFASASPSSMQLFVQIGYEGMSLAALLFNENKFIALETYTFQGVYGDDSLKECVEAAFEKSYIVKKGNYKSTSVAIVNNRSSMVPIALYDETQKQALFNFNHEMPSSQVEIHVDTIKNIEAKNIYIIPDALKRFLSSRFSSLHFFHFSTPLVDTLLTFYKNHAVKKVLVHVQLTHFEVVVLEGKHLVFYNTFNHTTAEDFMYYLLFVFEQLKLNPETQEAIVIGEIERNSVIYSLMQKYIRNVKFGNRPENFVYSYKLNELSKHFYYNLFSLPLCV